MELAWQPVADVTAATTIAAVSHLFAQHGAPLILKSDNGPAFKSADWLELLNRWRVTRLLSPPHAPWYNGSCERGIGALQARTAYFAARHGRPDHWTRADLHDAARQANQLHRPEDRPHASAQQLWDARTRTTEEARTLFEHALEGHRAALEEKSGARVLNARQRARLEREAARQALEERGLLHVTWRSIPLPLTVKKVANIM
jgi:transposase InsO family protein